MVLPALEQALQAWLREQLPLPPEEGEISFDSPDGTWGATISRPTLNLFLFDIARAAHPPVHLPAFENRDGVLVQEPPAPSVAISYLLSAWGGGIREEHRLLGDAIRSILSTPRLSPAATTTATTTAAAAAPVASTATFRRGLVAPVHLGLADPEHLRARELWAGLGGQLRASMVLVATTAIPVGTAHPVATRVSEVEAGASRFPDAPEQVGTRPAGPTDGQELPAGPVAIGSVEERRSVRLGSRVLRRKTRV